MQYSFIIPVYNCAPYLEACVDSIRQVGAADSEILLIDDGSTDGSGAVCDALAARFSEIRVIHQTNSGASAARNRGIQEALGTWLLFVDADDTLDSAALLHVLSRAPWDNADMVIFGLTFDYYRYGKCYRRDPLFFPHDGILATEDWGIQYLELFQHNSLSPLWNKVFRRDILVENHLELREDMFLYEDLEFVLRYMAHCNRICNIPQAVYHYRQPEDEGNARRRLCRIVSIPQFLTPIEVAVTQLRHSNPAITDVCAEQMLLSLYLVLAREKISVSDAAGVRRICQEFKLWREQLPPPVPPGDKFQKRLLREHTAALIFHDKKTALRHRIAVWVKSHMR